MLVIHRGTASFLIFKYWMISYSNFFQLFLKEETLSPMMLWNYGWMLDQCFIFIKDVLNNIHKHKTTTTFYFILV